MITDPARSNDRLHGLDALRGGALLLGVVLHASMSFIPAPIWIVQDDQTSAGAGALFFAIHLFRMATFFLLAGLFGHMLIARMGTLRFVRNRLVRIAAPLVAFWPLAMAGIVAVLIWNYSTHAPAKAGPPPPPPTYDWTSLPLTHLWFLWVLLLFYAALVLAHLALKVVDRSGVLGRAADRLTGLLVTPAGAFILGAPLALALWNTPGWVPFFGIPTPDHGLVPNPAALVGFGLAFALGVLIDRRRDRLERIAAWTPALLGVALGAAAIALVLSGGPVPRLVPIVDPGLRAMAACAVGVATYASALAAVGLSLRLFSGHSAVRRYLADASYWTYIVHLPLVMAAQVLVQDLAWPWRLKLVAVVAGVMGVCLTSYELLIRHSFMGRWLNGRRVPWRRRADPALVAAE